MNVVAVDFAKLAETSSPETVASKWEPGLSADKLKYRFEHKGVRVTMFRRAEGRAWEIKPKLNGKQNWMSTDVSGTTRDDLALAVKRAKFKLDELWQRPFDAPKAVPASAPKPIARIGELIERYEERASAVSFRDRVAPDTAAQNVRHLKRVIRWAKGKRGAPAEDLDVNALSSNVLSRELVDAFIANYTTGVETADHRRRNELAVDKRLNGAAHTLRQARSIFARDKRPLFAGLQLPNLIGFLGAARMPVTHREHKAIPPETVTAMDAAAQKLRTSDPRLWLVHTCMKHFGARPSEIHEAQMGWLQESAWGQWFFAVVVTETSRPKASLGYTPIPPAVAKEIVRVRLDLAKAAAGEEMNDQSPLIPGAHNEDRYNAIYRVHSEWMRQFVPIASYDGTNKELRRWATQTIRSKYGKDAASDFARHAPTDVTQQHYLERMLVWRDRAPKGDGGISFADARGRKIVKLPRGSAPKGGGWRKLA